MTVAHVAGDTYSFSADWTNGGGNLQRSRPSLTPTYPPTPRSLSVTT